MRAQYVPGKWSVSQQQGLRLFIVEDEAEAIAEVLPAEFDAEMFARADLMAAAPEMAEIVTEQFRSTNCICKGSIGHMQKLMGTAVECTKCRAESVLKKAGLL
jgi:hypothetical protein